MCSNRHVVSATAGASSSSAAATAAPAAAAAAAAKPSSFSVSAVAAKAPAPQVVRIDGGTGAIGSAVSKWLVATQGGGGALRSVTLTGRSGRSRSRLAGQRRQGAHGGGGGGGGGENGDDCPGGAAEVSEVTVTSVACDCATSEGKIAAETAAAASSASLFPRHRYDRRGRATGVLVIHAGGALRDALLPSQTAGSFRQVFAPKVRAASSTTTMNSKSATSPLEVAGSLLTAPVGRGHRSHPARPALKSSVTRQAFRTPPIKRKHVVFCPPLGGCIKLTNRLTHDFERRLVSNS